MFDLSYDLSDICDISLRVTVRNLLECENGSRGGVLGILQAGRLEHLPPDDQTSLIIITIMVITIYNQSYHNPPQGSGYQLQEWSTLEGGHY